MKFTFPNGEQHYETYQDRQPDPTVFINILRVGIVFDNVLLEALGFAMNKDAESGFSDSF